MENERKKRLHELKREQQGKTPAENAHKDATGDLVMPGATEGDDINNFIKEVVERKKARKQQLEIVHDFFENPAAYGVDTDIIPSSTTVDEIDIRKKELQHKIDLLRSVLKALEGEMQLLSQVTISDGSDAIPAGDTNSSQQTMLEKKASSKKTAPKKKAPKNRSTAKKPAQKKAAAKTKQ